MRLLKLSDIKNIQDILKNINNDNYVIIEIDNFLSNDECNDLVTYADSKHYQNSLLVGNILSPARKSNQVWIYDSENKIALKISNLVRTLTGSSIDHMEPLQLLRYGKGEYFGAHYDADNELDRIYTIIIYLNDEYTGGITRFNNLNYNIKPKKGKAVLFKSIVNEVPTVYNQVIEKSIHQGCEIYSGIKYICNKWVHINKYI